MTFDQKDVDRFWSKVDKNGPIPDHCPEIGPCWTWTSAKHKNGYGAFRLSKPKWVTAYAHRLSWELHYGPVEVDSSGRTFDVCHHCDNRSCVRPEHMFVGSRSDNMRDMREKGRGACGEKNGSKTHPGCNPKGTRHWNSLLTEESATEVRVLHSKGLSYQALAEQFGVHPWTISDVVRRKTWKHVP